VWSYRDHCQQLGADYGSCRHAHVNDFLRRSKGKAVDDHARHRIRHFNPTLASLAKGDRPPKGVKQTQGLKRHDRGTLQDWEQNQAVEQ